jgi:hypothetical protein
MWIKSIFQTEDYFLFFKLNKNKIYEFGKMNKKEGKIEFTKDENIIKIILKFI